ncbi:M20 family metallo-hydrolase [Desulfonatronovibrio hydrogenovorans]|uniref:M20 family metallo-hydrolase n=1 Tax=Desulfonatronovibrio hydrogenovorans TaxID=53245 RepID=UPI00048B1CB2|nr:M20 family metallo-hydrolase [Desulfonatronovibrio hydrogenovorans]
MSRISQYLDDQKDLVVHLQQKLVAIPALGPDNNGQGEKAKADFLLSYLKDTGFDEIIEVNCPDERAQGGYRPNIVARIPGKKTDKTLWIISHLDIVPTGDLSLWESDPFTLRVDGDLIYGRGVEDNHQGLVSSILAAKSFLDLEVRPEINIGLIMVADEETGNKYGLPFVLDQKKELFGRDDLFLVPDFGTPDSKMVEVAEKSMLWQKVTVSGRQCHASRPDKGINTLVASAAFILKLEELHNFFSDQSELFSPPGSTFCPTKKEANVPNINTIPGMDVFYLDCRVLPNYRLEAVLEKIRELGAGIEEKYRVKIGYETVLLEQAAPFTDPSSEIVVELTKAITTIRNVEPVAQGIGGGTVASFLRHKGFDAVVWATLTGTAHQPNECSSISNTINDAKVMAFMASPW